VREGLAAARGGGEGLRAVNSLQFFAQQKTGGPGQASGPPV